MADTNKSKINGAVNVAPMPIDIVYTLTILNGETQYIVDVLDGVQLTRAVDCTPSKLTFKVPKDPNLNFEEGNSVSFEVNGVNVFKGYIFEKSRDNLDVISVIAYDQLRYLKNKDCYVLKPMRADEFVKNVCDDYKLQVGELDNTVWTTPEKPQIVFKDKSLQEMIMQLLDKTLINTPNHAYYHLYDDNGKIMLKSFEALKTDIYIDDDVIGGISYTTSIDKDTYNYVKVVRTVPNGKESKLENTFIAVNEENVKKWGRLQYLIVPGEKDINATVEAKAILSSKNRKTREIKLSNVIGDVRVRGGSLVYINKNFGDVVVNNYMQVNSVTHDFRTGYHSMTLDLRWVDAPQSFDVLKDTDAETVKKIKAEKAKSGKGATTLKTAAGGTAGQVDTAFSANDGRVSQYGSNGCADTVCAAGSYYNSDLKDEFNKGTARVDTLRENLEAKGYTTEQYTGYANKGDLLIYGDDDHVVIADGSGGCFGNSSSRGYAMKYGNVNYAWGNDEAPTKIIRMGAS